MPVDQGAWNAEQLGDLSRSDRTIADRIDDLLTATVGSHGRRPFFVAATGGHAVHRVCDRSRQAQVS